MRTRSVSDDGFDGVAKRRTSPDRSGIMNERRSVVVDDSRSIRRCQPACCAGRPSNLSSVRPPLPPFLRLWIPFSPSTSVR